MAENDYMMMQRPTLKHMFITSTDSLTHQPIDQNIRREEGWNDQPPLFLSQKKHQQQQQLSFARRLLPQEEVHNYKKDGVLLKGMIRKGVPPVLQCAVWLSNIILSVHPHETLDYAYEYRTLSKVRAIDIAYEALLQRIHGGTNTSADNNNGNASSTMMTSIPLSADSLCNDSSHCKSIWRNMGTPTFGLKEHRCPISNAVNLVFNYDIIPESGLLSLKRVLICLQDVVMGGIIDSEYVPLIPTIVAIFLTRMSESYAFCAVREMAHDHRYSCTEYETQQYYFPTSPREEMAWSLTFKDVLAKLHPQTANAWNYTINDTTKPCYGLYPIFQDFFTSILPMKYVLRIMDIYTLEGNKVLFRFGIALMVLFKIEMDEQEKQIKNLQKQQQFDSTNNIVDSQDISNESKSNNSNSEENGKNNDNNNQNENTNSSSHSHNSTQNKFKRNLWIPMSKWTHSDKFSWDYVTRKAYGIHGRGARTQKRFPRRKILCRIIKMEEDRLLNDPKFDTWNYYDADETNSAIQKNIGNDNNTASNIVTTNTDGDTTTTTTNTASNESQISNGNSANNQQQHNQNEEEKEVLSGRPLGLIQPNSDDNNGMPSTFHSLSLLPPQERSVGDDKYNKEKVKMILGSPMETRLQLANWLPLSLQSTSLKLIYSTNHHGRTLETFYNHVSNSKHTILVCEAYDKNDKTSVIGMYASQPWRASAQVFGDGQCFLFRLKPNAKCWKWNPSSQSNEQQQNQQSTSLSKRKKHHQRQKSTATAEETAKAINDLLSGDEGDDGDDDHDDLHISLRSNVNNTNSNNKNNNPYTTSTSSSSSPSSTYQYNNSTFDNNSNDFYYSGGSCSYSNNQTALLEQYMVATKSYISMGGNHDGSCGLRFNEDFTIGESSTAAGYNNEPLGTCDSTNKNGTGATSSSTNSVFEVGLVEVYELVQSYF